MKPGYIYILTNESMPGLVKIGRTERQPEVRSTELRTTGVPQPFKLEHFVFVDDSHAAEQLVHGYLEKKGLRTSANREFFSVTLTEAIEAVDFATNLRNSREPDFDPTNAAKLAALASAISLPKWKVPIDFDSAEALAERLEQIALRGYPHAMQMCADLFYDNCPSSLRFKDYWQRYLRLAQTEAIRHPVPSGGRKKRQEVGRDVAEYITRCNDMGWLQDADFSFVSELLVQGDQFQYEGYIEHIRRLSLPPSVRTRAESA